MKHTSLYKKVPGTHVEDRGKFLGVGSSNVDSRDQTQAVRFGRYYLYPLSRLTCPSCVNNAAVIFEQALMVLSFYHMVESMSHS